MGCSAERKECDQVRSLNEPVRRRSDKVDRVHDVPDPVAAVAPCAEFMISNQVAQERALRLVVFVCNEESMVAVDELINTLDEMRHRDPMWMLGAGVAANQVRP